MSSGPTAFAEIQNKETAEIISCKIFKAEIILEEHNHNSKELIISKTELKVAVKGGYINILELQVAGKKRMELTALLNGFSFAIISSIF